MKTWLKMNEECYALRADLKELTQRVRELMGSPEFATLPAESDAGEMKANIMLAYRHLEDAAMRLGKTVQAYDGGTSIYPR